MRGLVADGLVLAGLAMLASAAWWVHVAAALAVVGAACLLVGAYLARTKGRQ
jgi:hypothetical protein